MKNSLQDMAFQVLSLRGVWDRKQELYYEMRHDGARRIKKPWPNAADSHFPLIDMNIGNLKPFWVAQAFNGDRLADFTSLIQQTSEFTESAADYFSYEMKHYTQWRLMFERGVDIMLLRGRGCFKIVYNPFNRRIEIKAIDPVMIIMGSQYDDFDDADWFVEVQHVTVPQYKRNRNYNQDDDLIDQIRGKADDDWQLSQFKWEKEVREGVTHSNREDIIVLWNFYERTSSGWLHHTHAPLKWDAEIRAPYTLNTEWDGEPLQPFYSITMEIKDEGWYSPRGIAELNAPFEAYCTKLWNDKSDAMTFGNTPMFTSDGPEKINTSNYRFMPGEYVPGNIRAVQMAPPAYSFSEEINFTREVSEQRSKMPDYGIRDESTGSGSKPRTATENNRIAALQDVGADHNGDIMRNVRLVKIYRHIWALMCHRAELSKLDQKPDPMTYVIGQDLKKLPEQVMHDKYLVVPAGQPGTKDGRLNRAVARFQLFRGAPNVDQDELVRGVIAADDARLVNKLLLPGNLKQGAEAEDEAMEIVVMQAGWPAVVMPDEDHATRLMVLATYLEKQHATGQPVDPVAIQRIRQHMAQHYSMLRQNNPQAAKEVLAQIQQLEARSMPNQTPVQPIGQPEGAMQ